MESMDIYDMLDWRNALDYPTAFALAFILVMGVFLIWGHWNLEHSRRKSRQAYYDALDALTREALKSRR